MKYIFINQATILLFFILISGFQKTVTAQDAYIRINQAGYLPADNKRGIVFSNKKIKGIFKILHKDNGEEIFQGELIPFTKAPWGNYIYYHFDFSNLKEEGTFIISLPDYDLESTAFPISKEAYQGYTQDILSFMHQQRCGYNPFFDVICHKHDGRIFYGDLPDSSYIDASGGWHDAGDQLKYLITGSFATAFMLQTYLLEPEKFDDNYDSMGRRGSNGITDILDEAKWGLDWIHKLHPNPKTLIHQVGDDRDHIGWKMPDHDNSDYGWGANSYRVAYVANGKPQGLNRYKSESTGIANIAGRSAAAMALGYSVWLEIDSVYAFKCLNAASQLYNLGKTHEGFQQGNSYGAPYRYNERTWNDDMEWAAAELYGITGKEEYLNDAIQYARKAGTTSWMAMDSASHYEMYPFLNMGHYALFKYSEKDLQDELASYYRTGIEQCIERSKPNPFKVGVPFIWCSNNLVTALISQIILYEKMTGDTSYHAFMLLQRDWLLGNNPWGTSMFMNIPSNGEYPVDVHTSTWALTKIEVPGGLVDGPVYASIYNNLKGLHLSRPDPFKIFQNDIVVYHDDIGDYSTNEPTMDGTASALLMMAYFSIIPGP